MLTRSIMHRLVKLTRVLALIAPAATQAQMVTSLLEKSSNPPVTATLDCISVTGVGCRIVVGAGEVKVPLHVLIRSIPDAQPRASQPVHFSSARCCLTTKRDSTDALGIAQSIWAGTIASRDSVIVDVHFGAGQSNRIVLIDTVKPAATVYRLYAVAGVDQDWFASGHLPKAVSVEILDQNDAPVAEPKCSTLKLLTRPRAGKTVDTIPATYYPSERNTKPGRCIAEVRWKLSEMPGVQRLDVSVTGANGSLTVDAVARAEPRIITGPALFYQEGSNLLGFFGVEFPVFQSAIRPNHNHNLDRLRIIVGTSFENPEDDYFAAISLLPLVFGGPHEFGPVQVSVGRANGGRWVGSLNVNALDVVKPLLKKLGVEF
jgi:hypothetical protein